MKMRSKMVTMNSLLIFMVLALLSVLNVNGMMQEDFSLFEVSQAPPLELSESIELHLKLIPLSEELKNEITNDNIAEFLKIFNPVRKVKQNEEIELALFYAVLTNAKMIAYYLIQNYPEKIYTNIQQYETDGLWYHVEHQHPKFEYSTPEHVVLGDYPLFVAVQLRNMNIVEMMKEHMEDHSGGCYYVTISIPGTGRGIWKPTATLFAAVANDVEMLEILLRRKSHGQDYDVKRLLKGYANPDLLDHALEFNAHDSSEFFIDNFTADETHYGINTLLKAAQCNNPKHLKKMIQNYGTELIESRDNGPRLLSKICENLNSESMIEAMKIILDNGGFKIMNIQDHLQHSPLITLAYYTDIEEDLAIKMTKLLFQYGPDIKLLRNGLTAFDIAIWRGENRKEFAAVLKNYEENPTVVELLSKLKQKEDEIEYLLIIQKQEKERKREEIQDLSRSKEQEIQDLIRSQEQQIQDLIRREKERQREENQCVICLLNPKTHICIPCGHISACAGCVATFQTLEEENFQKECPMCRGVGNFYQTY